MNLFISCLYLCPFNLIPWCYVPGARGGTYNACNATVVFGQGGALQKAELRESGAWLRMFDDVTRAEKSCVAKGVNGKRPKEK